VDGVVFAVHGKESYVVAFYRGHDDFAGSYQDFFVGKRDGFSLLDSLVGCGQADDANCRRHNHFHIRMGGDTLDSLCAEKYFGIGLCGVLAAAFLFQSGAKVARPGFCADRY